jgi:hypothetical protein
MTQSIAVADFEARFRQIWDELCARCDPNGPLPFAQVDPSDPKIVLSLWNVTESGSAHESPQCK